ncbi:MAG: NAD(P)H-hydrate dehydratase [Candidatus Thorarchaeota archaeon]
MNSEKISTLEMSIADVNSEYLGVNRIILMENAGKGLAELVWEVYSANKLSDIVIFAGKGGNGGDGMVAARHLSRNLPIHLFLIGSHKNITKRSTLQNWKVLQNMSESVKIKELKQTEDIRNLEINSKTLIVDCILGTGIKGRLREPLVTLIQTIKRWQKQGAIVISADTPTGINPNTGEAANVFLTPQHTGIFHKQKKGLTGKNAGKIRVLSIGVPPEAEKIVGPGDLLALKSRNPWSKKGDNGRVLVIGGNETYSGAPALTGMGAVQSGVDLVSILAPRKVSNVIRSYSPEFIVYDYPSPYLTVKSLPKELIEKNDVIALGPGLGQHPDTKEAVSEVLTLVKQFEKSIVIDADALKLLNMKEVTSKTILTPHAGEFTILTDISIPASSHEFYQRCELVQQVSAQFPNVWVIKGHWDIVTDQTERLKINKTGISQMTRGGTGDVLAGLIAGFLTQTKIPFYAACIGAYINGRAGELVKKDFNLSNLLRHVPVAIKEVFEFIQKDST